MNVDGPVADQAAQTILELLLDDAGDIDIFRRDIDVVDALVGEIQFRTMADRIAHERQQVGAGAEVQGIVQAVCAIYLTRELGPSLEFIGIIATDAAFEAGRK